MAISPITQPQNTPKPHKPLDGFYTRIKNPADMTDTVSVPRTVFKGYLGFMSGSFFTVAAAALAKKTPKTSLGLNLTGIALMIYGTYSFVRPYIFKNIKGVTK